MGSCSSSFESIDDLFREKKRILINLRKEYEHHSKNSSPYSQKALNYISQEIAKVRDALTFQELERRVIWQNRLSR